MFPPLVITSVLQLLLAATFLVIPVVAYRHGGSAQRAAEAQLESQGFTAEVLSRHHIRFAESHTEMLFPFAIALCMAVLASLNLFGIESGRVLSLIVQPLLLIVGGFITTGQMFPVQFTESALKKSSDTTEREINVKAFMDAARSAFPAWLRYIMFLRFVLVTAGSVIIVILLVIA